MFKARDIFLSQFPHAELLPWRSRRIDFHGQVIYGNRNNSAAKYTRAHTRTPQSARRGYRFRAVKHGRLCASLKRYLTPRETICSGATWALFFFPVPSPSFFFLFFLPLSKRPMDRARDGLARLAHVSAMIKERP